MRTAAGTDRVRRFGLDGSGGELPSLVADEDLARLGGLREHRRPDSHVPGEPQRPRPPDQGLTRRQAEAVNQAGAVMARQAAASATSASRASRLARTARSASSSCTVVTPNTPIRCSLSLAASFPPCRSSTAVRPETTCSCTTP